MIKAWASDHGWATLPDTLEYIEPLLGEFIDGLREANAEEVSGNEEDPGHTYQKASWFLN